MNEAYSSSQARKQTCILSSNLHALEGNAGCNQVSKIKESKKGNQLNHTLHDELAGALDLGQHIGASFGAPVGWGARVCVRVLIVPVKEQLRLFGRFSRGDGPHAAAPSLVPALIQQRQGVVSPSDPSASAQRRANV